MRWYCILTGVIVVLCVLIGILAVSLFRQSPEGTQTNASAQTVAHLEEQVRRMERAQRRVVQERDLAQQEAKKLKKQLLALADLRKTDQQVLKELWSLVTDSTRSAAKRLHTDSDPNAPADEPVSDTSEPAGPDAIAADFRAINEILNAGGDVGALVRQIVTPQGIERMLQAHRDRPAYWTTAARLAEDPQIALAYLEEAVRLHPESPEVLAALVQARIDAGVVDDSTLGYIRDLERNDPTNALGDCYAAHCQFSSGDISGALQSLSQASAKGRFADDHIGALMSQYEFLLNEGVPDAMALGMAFLSPPADHWPMIRQVEMQSMAQARALLAAGQYDDALKIAQDITHLGRNISSSGRFFLGNVIGSAIQKAGLSEQRVVYEALANAPQVQEVDERLGAIEQEMTQMRTMGQVFDTVMDTMNEDDFAKFVDGAILNGEFAAMRDIPEVGQALQQAQVAQDMELEAGDFTTANVGP